MRSRIKGWYLRELPHTTVLPLEQTRYTKERTSS